MQVSINEIDQFWRFEVSYFYDSRFTGVTLLYYNGKICYRIKLIIRIYVSNVKSRKVFLFLQNSITTIDILIEM